MAHAVRLGRGQHLERGAHRILGCPALVRRPRRAGQQRDPRSAEPARRHVHHERLLQLHHRIRRARHVALGGAGSGVPKRAPCVEPDHGVLAYSGCIPVYSVRSVCVLWLGVGGVGCEDSRNLAFLQLRRGTRILLLSWLTLSH